MRNLSIARPKTLVHAVTERLRAAIVDAELGLGEQLSEEGLAAALGVSRTPVREALSLLQLQGLIDIAPQRGSYVFRPTEDDIARLCEFRISQELAVAPLAAERAHAATLAALKHDLALMEKAFAGNHGLAYVKSDDQLHSQFFAHCGNRYFMDAYALISSRIAALRNNLSTNHPVDQELSLSEHRKIAEYFAAKDIVSLQALLVIHIGRTRENFIDAHQRGLFSTHSPTRENYSFSPILMPDEQGEHTAEAQARFERPLGRPSAKPRRVAKPRPR